MMINYETIVDGISAIIVILIVATIIAAAWISTNVREQPLIATAVVVFQRQNDGDNTDQNSNEESPAQNSTNNDNSDSSSSRISTADTNIASASPLASPSVAPSVRPKEPRSQIKGAVTMEENSKKSYKEQGDKDKELDIMKLERRLADKGEEKFENKQEEQMEDIEKSEDDVICFEESSSAGDIKSSIKKLDKCQKEKGDYLDKCDILDLKNDSSIATSTSTSLPIQKNSVINKTNEITPEMEIRNRRLKHFISMGNEDNSENISETIVENLYEESNCKEETNSKENSDTKSKSQIESAVESSVSETTSLEPSEDKNPVEILEKREEIEPAPPGSIRIRLKFLDDTLRFVHALPTDLIGHFKRQQFSLEISENRHIRLIFNGQLLSSDSSTLAHYGLFDNCVVHCHVSAPRQPTPESSSNNGGELQHDEDDTFMSGLLAPLLYCVLMVMWYLRYQYGHLFNTCSSVILLCLTALLLISTYLLYTTQQQQQQQQPPTTNSSNHNSSTLNTNAVGQITLGAS